MPTSLPMFDAVQAFATESPVVFGVLVLVAAAAAVSVVKFVVRLAIRVAMLAAIAFAAWMAIGYLG